MKTMLSIAFTVFASAAFAAQYELDSAHSEVGFSVKHLMISNVKGHFDKFSGSFDYDGAKKTLKDVNVTIEVGSVNTANGKRDEHLQSPDFFDAKKFPKMTFKSTKVEMNGATAKVTGDLTIRDKTKSVVLDFTNNGEAEFMGTKKIAFTGTGKIKRADFGLAWNKTMDKGGVVVGDDVTIQIEGEANQAAPAKSK